MTPQQGTRIGATGGAERVDSPETGVAGPQLVESLRDEIARLTGLVEDQKRIIRELRHEVVRDPLTGLLNRRGFQRVLERTIDFVGRYRSDVSLVFVDLNAFKLVNDCYGHAAGDAALRHVARAMARALRRSDVIGRMGGDEFVALLWKADEATTRETAERVATAVAEPFAHDCEMIQVTVSIGVAEVRAGSTASEVLDRADRDMYRVKAATREAR